MNKQLQMRRITRSVEDFSADFYKNFAEKKDGNFICSALSAHIGLGMIASGAEGSTAHELKQGLKFHYDCNHPRLHLAFQNLIDTLNSVTDVTLNVANKIYAAHDISLSENFKKITGSQFRSECETIDFLNSENAAEKINKWCAEKTNDKVKDVFTTRDVNESTRLILLNAIYFKSSWKYKFDTFFTEEKPFYKSRDEVKQVPTMYIEKKLHYEYLKELDAELVVLPYEVGIHMQFYNDHVLDRTMKKFFLLQNKNTFMVIVVPKKMDGLEILEKNLAKIRIDYDWLDCTTEKVQLFLPKFKVESTLDLKDSLTEMGIGEMFTSDANFRGISNESLIVSKVIQKAFVEVDEEGTEAAVVTAIAMESQCAPSSVPQPSIVVKVDRPFLYRVVFGDIRLTLFSGRVNDPSAQ